MRKPDTPCAGGCGKVLWGGARSRPAGERRCRECRQAELAASQGGGAKTTVPQEFRGGGDVRFAARGQRLWDEMGGESLDPARRLLLQEVCRMADRLDRLDVILCGDAEAWRRFRVSDDGAEVTVIVDKALSEARQHAVALKQMVAELRQSATTSPPAGEVSVLDQLAARRAARLANTPG